MLFVVLGISFHLLAKWSWVVLEAQQKPAANGEDDLAVLPIMLALDIILSLEKAFMDFGK